jgi:serine phosphatase RsbU (regulator of sigma subunit)
MNTVSIISSLIASIMLAVMAAFVLFKDWRDQVNRYYVFYNIAGLGILFTMFLTYAFPDRLPLTDINRITQLSTVLFFSGLMALSFVFPKTEKRFPLYKTLIMVFPAVIVGGIAGFTDLTITRAYFEAGQLERDFRPIYGDISFYDVYAVIAGSYLLIGTGNFIRKYFQTKIEIYRLQMRYLFVGGSVAIILAAICSIVLPRIFNYSQLYVLGPSMASFFMTSALFYSVINYNLMDIRSVIHKTVMYSIISTVIILPIYSIVQVYDLNIFNMGQVPVYIVSILVIVIFILFSVFIQPVIDKVFKRRQYEFENMVDTFIRDIKEVTEISSIAAKTVKTLVNSLFLKKAFLLLINDETRKYELFYSESSDGSTIDIDPLERNSSLIRWFIRNQDILMLSRVYTDDKSFGEIRDDITGFFIDNELQLILPLYYERRLVGLICLGDKDTLSSFQPDEVVKLGQFLQKSNDFFSTALSYEKAMKEQLQARTIDLSSEILANSIPVSLPKLNEIKFGAFMVPKYSSGIDYFDFIRVGDQGIGIIVTDISGIGVNSALYSVLLRSGAQANINEASSTSTMMQNLNKLLFTYSEGRGGLVTAYYIYYDIKSMRLMYTNAGFPALEVFRVDKNNFDSLDTQGIPLGYDETISYGMGRTNLQRGDIGVLYTKTMVNSKNQKGEEFGILRLRSLIMDNRARAAGEIASRIKESFESFMGLSTPDSDVISLVFKIT